MVRGGVKNMSYNKQKSVKVFLITCVSILLLNTIGAFLFTRVDLTSEKRYTLSKVTRQMLRDLDDIVYFKVYLEGEFPAGFKRLRNETRELLEEFRAYSSNIQYEFVNPAAKGDKERVQQIREQLMSKGLQPTSLQVKTDDGFSEQVIFPGAIVTYRNKELPLQLLLSQIGQSPEVTLNNSIETLEYNIASLLKKVTQKSKPAVAFIEGHGELSALETGDAMWLMSEFYQVKRIRLDEKIYSLLYRSTDKDSNIIVRPKYKAIVIAQPDSAFSEKDKFIIDQYIMHGGKVLFCIDPVYASMDSLQTVTQTISFPITLNLEDLLFKYGVRLNANLILDKNACPIPVVTGMNGNQPQQSLLPWVYFPMVMPRVNHPIVKNVSAIKFEFVSSLDTVTADEIKKTILLHTSEYSAVIPSPSPVSLELLMRTPDIRLFNKPYQPIAVLMEGEFQSVFANRIPPQLADDKLLQFKETSHQTSMIVVSDGDVIKNQIRLYNGAPEPLPLGYDKYTRQQYGNGDFIMNSMNYLCDDTGLLSLRSREIKLRLLDKIKIHEHRLRIQLLNVLVPIFLVILFGLIKVYIRKRKYTRIHA